MSQDDHPAKGLTKQKPIVFTAISWKYFAYRMFISKFVLEQDCVPINPFTSFDYFMLDTVERDIVREANNNLLLKADELWCFGSISDGVKVEIDHMRNAGKTVKFFRIERPATFIEVSEEDMKAEE